MLFNTEIRFVWWDGWYVRFVYFTYSSVNSCKCNLKFWKTKNCVKLESAKANIFIMTDEIRTTISFMCYNPSGYKQLWLSTTSSPSYYIVMFVFLLFLIFTVLNSLRRLLIVSLCTSSLQYIQCMTNYSKSHYVSQKWSRSDCKYIFVSIVCKPSFLFMFSSWYSQHASVETNFLSLLFIWRVLFNLYSCRRIGITQEFSTIFLVSNKLFCFLIFCLASKGIFRYCNAHFLPSFMILSK